MDKTEQNKDKKLECLMKCRHNYQIYVNDCARKNPLIGRDLVNCLKNGMRIYEDCDMNSCTIELNMDKKQFLNNKLSKNVTKNNI